MPTCWPSPLDKTGAGFSPTTRYRDYAISRDLIRWESRGIVRADGETGHRYQTHVRDGHSMLLFARLHANDRAFWFLGPATYVDHRGRAAQRSHHLAPRPLATRRPLHAVRSCGRVTPRS
ncbi:MAG: DUF3427 domain-containing protein [Sandaracinaceae bacterium]|nr:DUF3427 domain-containing protein [Sandaracinaceae bacterium]